MEVHPGVFVSNVATEEWQPDPEIGGGAEEHVLFDTGTMRAGLSRFKKDADQKPPNWALPDTQVLLVLEGEANYDLLGGKPCPRAVAEVSGQTTELPASVTATGNRYRLMIDARAAASPQDGRVRITVRFDRHFVPRALGINPDSRELVVRAPSQRELRSRP